MLGMSWCRVCRYGVKGPVYVRNRDGQVVAAAPDGRCEWQSGSVRRHGDRIATASAVGTSTFSLFDHITVSLPTEQLANTSLQQLHGLSSAQVRISVRSTRCHADALHLEVISNKPPQSSRPQQPHAQGSLVQEVARLAEEATQKARQRPKLSKEEKQFCQSKTPNLYSLLEEVRELALTDLDMLPQVCASEA